MHPSESTEKQEPRNQSYADDIIYITRHNKWLLNSIGIWPVVLQGIDKILYKIKIGILSLVLLFTVIQSMLHVIFEQKDPLLRLKIIGLTFFSFFSLMKYWALIIKKSNILICIEQIHFDWMQVELQTDRQIMMKYGKAGRILTVLSVLFLFSGGIIYHCLLQYVIGSSVDEYNHTIRMLIYPTYNSFFDTQKSPIYEIVYVIQCVCGYVFEGVASGACGLIALFATHACGQIDLIASRLNDLFAGKFANENSTANDRLIGIVEHHLRVLRFSSTIESAMQEVCLLEIVSIAVEICLLQYYCLADYHNNNLLAMTTYTLLLISFTFNVFILCYSGDLLIEKSTSIRKSCFMTDWYRLPTDTIRGLILIMATSNIPTKISAGGIVDISLSTFANVLKSSFAYLNIIQTTVM